MGTQQVLTWSRRALVAAAVALLVQGPAANASASTTGAGIQAADHSVGGWSPVQVAAAAELEQLAAQDLPFMPCEQYRTTRAYALTLVLGARAECGAPVAALAVPAPIDAVNDVKCGSSQYLVYDQDYELYLVPVWKNLYMQVDITCSAHIPAETLYMLATTELFVNGVPPFQIGVAFLGGDGGDASGSYQTTTALMGLDVGVGLAAYVHKVHTIAGVPWYKPGVIRFGGQSPQAVSQA